MNTQQKKFNRKAEKLGAKSKKTTEQQLADGDRDHTVTISAGDTSVTLKSSELSRAASNYGGMSGEQLRQYIQKVERLEQEKVDIAADIRDVYAEAKANGFDPKIMRQLVKIRKMDPNDRAEQEELLDVYKHALGMLPLEEAAEERLAAEQAASAPGQSDTVTA